MNWENKTADAKNWKSEDSQWVEEMKAKGKD